MLLGETTFSGDQEPSEHGFYVGDFELDLGSVEISNAGAPLTNFSGLAVAGSTIVDGSKVQSDIDMTLDELTVPNFGNVSYQMQTALTANAAAFGRFMQAVENVADDNDPMQAQALIGNEAKDLVASGLDIDVPQFDVTLPMGKVEASLSVSTPEQDRDSFEWTSLLLKGKAKPRHEDPRSTGTDGDVDESGGGDADRSGLSEKRRRLLHHGCRHGKRPAYRQRSAYSYSYGPLLAHQLRMNVAGTQAGDPRTGQILQWRALFATRIDRVATTWMEHTAGRRIQQRRRLTKQRNRPRYGARVPALEPHRSGPACTGAGARQTARHWRQPRPADPCT